MSKAELAASYAAIILADDDIQPTVSDEDALHRTPLTFQTMQADKLQTLIKAANIDDVEPIWATLFAKVRRRLDFVQRDPKHYFQDANHLTRLLKART